MPEKQVDNYVLLIMFVTSLLMGLGNALAEEECLTHTSWRHLSIQVFIASISGMVFGFFALWLCDNQWAAFAISGAGSILGIKGVRTIAVMVMKKIEKSISEK